MTAGVYKKGSLVYFLPERVAAEISKKERKPYHHGDLKNALIRAGREVLESENGSAGFDLRLVARKAGVSHAAPYRHFFDKRALITAIVEAGFEEFENKMADGLAAAGGASASERLRVVAMAWRPWSSTAR